MRMNPLTRRATVVLAAAATLAAAYACRDAATPTAPTTREAEARLSPDRATLRAGLSSATQRMSWVGQIHNEAMLDLMQHKDQWMAGNGNRAARVCNAVARLTAKYAPRVDAAAGIRRTPAQRAAVVREAVAHAKECRGQAMSMFGSAGTARTTTAAALDDEYVNGEFEPYLNALTSAVDATDGTYWAVADAAYGVLNSAGGINPADYNVVASAVDLAVSSADYWNYMEDSGQLGGGGGTEEQPDMMALFIPRKAKIIGGSDLIGCAAGAASTWWAAAGGPVGWGALGGQCAIWGIAGSAGAWLAM